MRVTSLVLLFACTPDPGKSTGTSDTTDKVIDSGPTDSGPTDSGALVCWGENDDGESTPPREPLTGVSLGGYHSWGRDSWLAGGGCRADR